MFNLDNILILTRLLLAGLFLVSGITKLSNRQSFYETLINFGIPKKTHKALGLFLPWIEITLAIFLLLPYTVWVGGVISLILIAIFTILISYNLIKKKYPACNCFGVDNKPINAFTLLRNIGLIACSLLLVLHGVQYEHKDIAAWFSDISTMLGLSSLLAWLLVVIVLVEGWIILKLIRQHGRLILRIDNLEYRLDIAGLRNLPDSALSNGLSIGTQAPSFSLPNLNGDNVSLDNFLAIKKPIVLVFSDPGCGPCAAMIPSLVEWKNELSSEVTLILISRGAKDVNIGKFGELNLDYVLLQTEREIAELYKATATPSAIRIGIDGQIDSPIALGEVAIASLIYESASHRNDVATNSLSST